MGSMPLALSVHNFISSVGADAGFAAIIGLAILVLLYFAHARETANLREQAALLTQRLQQAEARVAQLTAAQPAAQPVPAPPRAAAAPVAARVAAAGALALPAAPAGVGAPALAAATRVVPLPAPAAPQPSPQSAAAPEPAVAAHAAPQPVVAPEAESVSAARTSPEPAVAVHAAQPLPGPGALTVAGENGNGNEPAAPPLGGAASAPGAPSRLQSRPATVVGNAGGRPELPPLIGPPRRSSRVWSRLALVAGALIVVAGVAALLIATSGGGAAQTSSSAASTTNAPGAKRSRSTPGFNPATVTVAVLNGTATNQLAHTVAAKLAGVGYKKGTIATASNQTEATTVVAYLPGAANRTDALHVANALRLGPSSVQPIDQSTQQVACPGPGACTANVVVTVGADLATL